MANSTPTLSDAQAYFARQPAVVAGNPSNHLSSTVTVRLSLVPRHASRSKWRRKKRRSEGGDRTPSSSMVNSATASHNGNAHPLPFRPTLSHFRLSEKYSFSLSLVVTPGSPLCFVHLLLLLYIASPVLSVPPLLAFLVSLPLAPSPPLPHRQPTLNHCRPTVPFTLAPPLERFLMHTLHLVSLSLSPRIEVYPGKLYFLHRCLVIILYICTSPLSPRAPLPPSCCCDFYS